MSSGSPGMSSIEWAGQHWLYKADPALQSLVCACMMPCTCTLCGLPGGVRHSCSTHFSCHSCPQQAHQPAVGLCMQLSTQLGAADSLQGPARRQAAAPANAPGSGSSAGQSRRSCRHTGSMRSSACMQLKKQQLRLDGLLHIMACRGRLHAWTRHNAHAVPGRRTHTCPPWWSRRRRPR